MTASRRDPKKRSCDFPYIVTVREAGVMAKKRSQKIRGEKTPRKDTHPSGPLSTSLSTSPPPSSTSIQCRGQILGKEVVFGLTYVQPSTPVARTRRPSFIASPRHSIRTKAKRWHFWCRAARTPMIKSFRAPSPVQQLQQQPPWVRQAQLPGRHLLPHISNFGQPPSIMSNALGPCSTIRNPNTYTSEREKLSKIIDKIETDKRDRDRLHGLVACAEEFKEQKQNRKCRCIDIKSLGHGSWNCAYRLTFSNGDTMAALVSNYEPKAFSRKMKESEIATMQYLHSTPKYNKYIKVPEVYSWDLTHDNKAGAPYIFREVIEGKDLSKEFDGLTDAQKMKVTTAIARVHKVLSQPADFNNIGGIFGSVEEGFHIGGYPASWSGSRPYNNLRELWQEKMDSNTQKLNSSCSVQSQRLLDTNQAHLKQLMNNFSPPGKLSRLCLQHFDLAIRNVCFNDNFEITGVIDWEFAQVVPLTIAARVPLEFTDDPKLRAGYKAAFTDIKTGTSSQDFEDSIDYIHFHDLIMGPDHAAAQRYVSYWINGMEKFFKTGPHRTAREKARDNGLVLRFPTELRELRRLKGEGPESPGSACL